MNVDNTKESPTVLSLCSGYGGIERGLDRVFGSVRVLAHVEIEAFAVANLVDKMETGQMVPAPVWTDVKTFPAHLFRGKVDILTGGYPCQPFSAAGKRAGTDDPRHLWPFIRASIRDCEPRYVFFENVEGHLSLGISKVLADLEEMDYRSEVGIFSAAEVGAPHQRKRVFILAHRIGSRCLDEQQCEEGQRPGTVDQCSSRPEELAKSKEPGLAEPSQRTERKDQRQSGLEYSRWPARPGEQQYDWEEPRVIVADHGSKRSQSRA
jgi:DNA (cytosine-5)-methyltransferase 1